MNLKEFIYKIIGMPTMEDDTSKLISPPVLVEFNGELLDVKDAWYRGDDTVIISVDEKRLPELEDMLEGANAD
jgi:hypothetical protein